MSLSRLVLHRQALHCRTYGVIRTKRWSSLPEPELCPPNAAASQPEKRAGGMNEAMNTPADAAEVQSEATKLAWPSIGGMLSKMKKMLANKQDIDETMDSEAIASLPIKVTSKECHITEHEASSLFSTMASDAVKEPECCQESEPKSKLSGGESKDSVSPIIKKVNIQNVLEPRGMVDSSPTMDVAQTQTAFEVMGTVLQGTEDDNTDSRREYPTMEGINPLLRADASERCSDFLKSIFTESKRDKVENGGVNLPRQDAESHRVKSSESEKETIELEEAGLLLNKMKSAKQSEETVTGMTTTNFIQGLLDNKNLSADQSGKHSSVKCLMDFIMDIPLDHHQGPRDSDAICQDGMLSHKGSIKLRKQLFDKEKATIRRQKPYSVAPVNGKSLDRTRDNKLKDFHILSQMGKGVLKAMDENRLSNPNYDNETAACADTSPKVLVPETTKDPGVPVALLKHPTRTVKIMHLPRDVTLHQLKESLQLTAGSISSLFLGSSGSVAYAEFKSEYAKEMAIAQHFIDVAGNHLHVLRVDAPKTNIIRISNLNSISREDISSICRRYGRVQKEMLRSDVFVDVYFDLSELPNMLNILNRLNGMRVQDTRLSAVPAPVFPEEVLRVLWDQPEGRRHVRSVLQNLSQKIERNIHTDELTHNLSAYYAD